MKQTHPLLTGHRLAILLGLIVLLVIMLASYAASAQSTIAIVNIQKIMRESKAANAVRSQVKSKQKSFQAELDKKEKELQDKDKELAKQRSILSQEAFEQQYKAFRKTAAEAQQEIRQKRAQLDKGFTKALADIQKKVIEIVSAVAKEKGADMAISSSQILYGNPSLEITDEVLGRLDKQMPNLSVNFNLN